MNFDAYRSCRLCPRQCGADRTLAGTRSYCGESSVLRVSHVGAHFGEEPPISGTRGSGTVFFTGCSLRCSYCQNYQISHDGIGRPYDAGELAFHIIRLVLQEGVHNVNFVTADHFLPHALAAVELIKKEVKNIPVLFNLSGYQSDVFLDIAEDFTDIYLPDYKYSDPKLAHALSRCRDYPTKALDAITRMIKQKGFLDSTTEAQIAKRGVLVRHLILPGYVANSINALTSLYLEFGPKLPLSLMSQYYPVKPHAIPPLNRRITREEFESVYEHCLSLGFENVFIQFPEDDGVSPGASDRPDFVPDFTSEHPFAQTVQSKIDKGTLSC